MKRCVMLAMAMTVAVNSHGGLFDNVIKNAVGVALPQEREKEQERRRSAIIAEQEERARQEEAERRRAEEEAERRRAAIIAEQEERARQEELRKAEGHKAYMAKLEQEEQERMRKQAEEFAAQIAKYQQEEQDRQRQREAERAEEAERRRQQEAEIAAEEFEQSFNTALMQMSADAKSGKYKKDIAKFKYGAGGVDDFERGGQLTSETVFLMNTAAKQVLSERSFSQLRKDAINRGKAEMLNIQSEIFTPGSHSANVLAAIPRTSVGMTIFDAKALESLIALKRERTEAKLREEQARKDAQNAKSLDF